MTGYQRYVRGRQDRPGDVGQASRVRAALVLPGAVGAGTAAGVRATGTGAKKNWRGRTENQKLLNLLTGVRATTYNAPLAKERGDYATHAQLKAYTEDHRQLAKEAGITDPEEVEDEDVLARLDEMNEIEKRREGKTTKGDVELTGVAKLRAERARVRRDATRRVRRAQGRAREGRD